MAEEAYSIITGKRLTYKETGDLAFIRDSILYDSGEPIRVIWSYYGYKTENNLRNSLKSFFSPLDLPLHVDFPNLIICADISIVKLDGLPFGLPYLSKDFEWTFTMSQKGHALYNFLNILWYRLCRKYNQSFELLADGRILDYHTLNSVRISPSWKNMAGGFRYSTIDYQKKRARGRC